MVAGESGRIAESLKGFLWQLKEDASTAFENGWLAGELAELALSEGELTAKLGAFALCQMESLPTSRYLLAPRALLQITAKQLSAYGGSLDTAATDLVHYLTGGYRVLVLCGGEVRARNLLRLLQERKIPAALDLAGAHDPGKDAVQISVGALSAGCEYPSCVWPS